MAAEIPVLARDKVSDRAKKTLDLVGQNYILYCDISRMNNKA